MTECFLCGGSEAKQCPECENVYSCTNHLYIHKPDKVCLPFRVGYEKEKGRIVIATRDIKAGEVVLTDHPLVEGPGNRSAATCLNCLASVSTADPSSCSTTDPSSCSTADCTSCSRCGWPVCNSACENGRWHAIECSTLAKLDEKPDFQLEVCLEYSAIFALRVCILAKQKEVREKLDFLMDHADDIVKEENFEELWSKGLQLIAKVDGLPYSGLRGVGIFCTNAVSMPHRNGRWLYPTFSFLSHSCVSNCRFYPHPGQMVLVRAQVDIKCGDEITISYLEPGLGTVLRKPYIENMWYFSCTCTLCTDPTELGTFFSAMTCRKCRDYVVQQNLLADEVWQCNKCKMTVDCKTMHTLAKTLHNQVKQVAEKNEVEGMIEKLSDLLHPNHFLLLALKEKWVKFHHTERQDLETGLKYVSDIIRIRKIMEPGLTLNLGENLKLLNQFMLNLGRMRLSAGEISKEEFMKMALGAASNIKFANKCFEGLS